jgi:hypothetical protein
MSFSDYTARDARLRILSALSKEGDYTLNEHLISAYLSVYGHKRSLDWLRNQLRWLEDVGAVKLTDAEGHMIAKIRRKGLDHLEGRLLIEGILRTDPEE